MHLIQTFIPHLKPLHHLHLDLCELDALNLKAAARGQQGWCLALDQPDDRLLSLEGKSYPSWSLLRQPRLTETNVQDIQRVLTAFQWLQPAGANQGALTPALGDVCSTLTSLTCSPPPTLGCPPPFPKHLDFQQRLPALPTMASRLLIWFSVRSSSCSRYLFFWSSSLARLQEKATVSALAQPREAPPHLPPC